jgi:hypothetical protein
MNIGRMDMYLCAAQRVKVDDLSTEAAQKVELEWSPLH